jgi:quaternary ammonium compound-resistance protein SugE
VSWLILIVAGVLEVVWASLLPATERFSRLVPSVVFVVALVASMALLAVATRSIPLGTAYAVWVGIGAVGTVLTGIVLRAEPVAPANLAALSLLVVAIVAVKLTSAH